MAITETMVQWLDQNISLEGYCLHEMEQVTGIDWQLRFQDFNDRNLKAYFARNPERRAVFIIDDLSEKAKDAGNTLISRHLNGFRDEDDFQSWLQDLKNLASRFS